VFLRIIFILLFSPCFLFSQNIKEVDLQNYCHYILGISGRDTLVNASGFIVHSKLNYFLVTNYHVLSGKDLKTNSLDPNIRVSPRTIAVRFRGRSNEKWTTVNYPLFDASGKAAYFILPQMADSKYFDLAILPIKKIDSLAFFAIEETQLDTNVQVRKGTEVLIAGFLKRKLNIIKSHTLTLSRLEVDQNESQLYFDLFLGLGFSGGPVFSMDFMSNSYKLIAINSGGGISGYEYLKGDAFYSYFIKLLIDQYDRSFGGKKQ
jgi:hypothetical protein